MSLHVQVSDLLTPPTNVGNQGRSGSNSDIAKSTRLPLRIVGMDMQRREFSPAGWRQFRRMEPILLDRRHVVAPNLR